MASIDALTGVFTGRQSLNATGENDSYPDSPGTESTTPAGEGQSHDREDEVLDFIEVGRPALPRSFTENERTTSSVFRVEVPEVQRRWEYRVFEEEYTIRSVLRELRVQNEVKYEVRFEDGHIALVRQSSTI